VFAATCHLAVIIKTLLDNVEYIATIAAMDECIKYLNHCKHFLLVFVINGA
jgi:hypothetical protein